MNKETVTIELENSSLSNLEVTGYYQPETPDVLYMPNGDPGYPGQSSMFEVDEVIWLKELDENEPSHIVSVDVTDLILSLDIKIYEEIEAKCIERMEA